MYESQRPAKLSEETWQATPPDVRQFIALLVAKFAVLEARLNQNSQNSSKPPSSDPPSTTPRLAKTPRGKANSQGAQPGHPDQQQEFVASENITRVVELYSTGRPSCRLRFPALLPSLGPPHRQQVRDLPVIEPEVTEYQYFSVCCPSCVGWVTAPRPDDIPLGTFDPRVAAYVALLHGLYRISHRELAAMFADLCKLPISLGSVVALQQVTSAALEPAYGEVQLAVATSDHANIDETTWREEMCKPWLWMAVTAVAKLFLIHGSRGKKDSSALVGEAFAGLVALDRLLTYNSVETSRRQLCWVHLLRSFQGRIDARGPRQAAAADLLSLAEVVMAVWGHFKAREIDRDTMRLMLHPVQQTMWEQVERGWHQSNSFGSLYANLATRLSVEKVASGSNLVCERRHDRTLMRKIFLILGGPRLKSNPTRSFSTLTRFPTLWTFVYHEGLEPTNNAAERALRPDVLWRRGCFGTQSGAGSRFAERMLTVSATLHQHQRPLLPCITDAIMSYWFRQPAPRLLLSAVTS